NCNHPSIYRKSRVRIIGSVDSHNHVITGVSGDKYSDRGIVITSARHDATLTPPKIHGALGTERQAVIDGPIRGTPTDLVSVTPNLNSRRERALRGALLHEHRHSSFDGEPGVPYVCHVDRMNFSQHTPSSPDVEIGAEHAARAVGDKILDLTIEGVREPEPPSPVDLRQRGSPEVDVNVTGRANEDHTRRGRGCVGKVEGDRDVRGNHVPGNGLHPKGEGHVSIQIQRDVIPHDRNRRTHGGGVSEGGVTLGYVRGKRADLYGV